MVDLSILIDLRLSRRLAKLRPKIGAGEIAVVSYSLKRLRSPAWRDWLERNRERVEVRLNPGREREEFARLLREHCGDQSNPRLDQDDVMAITVALIRGWPLAMRDNNAVKVAKDLGVTCIGVDELLPPPEGEQTRLF